VIVLVCLCGAGCLGALTAVLVFYHKLVGAELDKQSRRIIGIVLTLAIGVPLVALVSVSDTRQPDGTYVNGLVGQYLPIWSLLSYGVGFFYAWLAIRVLDRGRNA
jgi:O-antigen/teichoic acid export membrane protein